jgi:hypothetical protein
VPAALKESADIRARCHVMPLCCVERRLRELRAEGKIQCGVGDASKTGRFQKHIKTMA